MEFIFIVQTHYILLSNELLYLFPVFFNLTEQCTSVLFKGRPLIFGRQPQWVSVARLPISGNVHDKTPNRYEEPQHAQRMAAATALAQKRMKVAAESELPKKSSQCRPSQRQKCPTEFVVPEKPSISSDGTGHDPLRCLARRTGMLQEILLSQSRQLNNTQ